MSRVALVRRLRRLRLAALVLLVALGFAPVALGQRTAPMDVAVRVTGAEHEEPIERARVDLTIFPNGVSQAAITDATGQVLFRSVFPGSYLVRVEKAGYRSAEVQVDLTRGQTHRQVYVSLTPEETNQPSAPAGTVSARSLSIPASAQDEFRKGEELLRGKKNPKESVPHFRKAIDAFPAYWEAYFRLGMAQLQLNSLEDARASLAKAVELDSKSLGPYYPLAVVLITLKRYPEAETMLQRAMEMDPQGWQWPFELARCAAAQGQWEKALQYGGKAHEQPNAPTKVHLLMADLYNNTGNTKKQIEELEEFARLDPNSPFMPRVRQVLEQLRKP